MEGVRCSAKVLLNNVTDSNKIMTTQNFRNELEIKVSLVRTIHKLHMTQYLYWRSLSSRQDDDNSIILFQIMKFARIENVRSFEWYLASILRCLQNKEEKGQKGQLSEFWVFNYEVPVCSTPFFLFGMLILFAFLSALSICPSPSLDCVVFVLSKWSFAYHRTIWLSCLRPSLEPLWLFEFPCITILHSFPFEYWIPISNTSNSKHLFYLSISNLIIYRAYLCIPLI